MFQACVSISVCIFYILLIHRVCVYKWAYCWGKKKKKKITDLPTLFFSSPLRQYNNFFFGLVKVMKVQWYHKEVNPQVPGNTYWFWYEMFSQL